MTGSTTPPVLILAGKRGGIDDPLAAGARVTHKCLAPVAGEPMIVHVVRTVAMALPASPILISIDDGAVLETIGEIAALKASGRLGFVRAEPNLVDSIRTAARAARPPLILTTADNVLLSAEALRRIAAFGRVSDADAVVAMARREAVLAAHPDGQRRFYEFKGGAYSNCNLYYLGSDKALKAAGAFRSGGQFAKYPGRILAAFGLLNLLRFRARSASLETILASIGRRYGLKLVPLVMADGRLSIDVDNERTLKVTEEILAAG